MSDPYDSLSRQSHLARGMLGGTKGRQRQKLFRIVFFLLSLSALCSAIPVSSVYAQANVTACSSTDTSFCWHGGPVQHDPKVYLVFWGSEWNSDATSIYVKGQLVSFFQHLAGGNYNNILTQYSDGSGQINNDTVLEATQVDTVDPVSTTPLSMDTILQEAEHANALFSWPGWDINTQIMVFPQEGTAYSSAVNIKDSACGEHGYLDALPFSFVRFESTDDPNYLRGCGSEGPTGQGIADNMIMTASHEYAETATDPDDSGGWWAYQACTAPCNSQQEIGDKCNQQPISYSPANDPSLSFNIQLLWSNVANTTGGECVEALGNQYASPASPGQHTVKGLILQAYLGSGQDVGALVTALGAPMSEELPLAGGRVSYFIGTSCKGGYVFTNEVGNKVNSGSAIFYDGSTNGTYEVHGCIYQHYEDAYGGPAGPLGFPVTDEKGVADGTGDTGNVSYFKGTYCGNGGPDGSGSAIYWDGGAYEVQGCIYAKYQVMGGLGTLGFPVSDEQGVTDSTGDSGRVSYFKGTYCGNGGPDGSGSAIYYLSPVETFEVQGCIYDKYQSMGGLNSALGFPVSDEEGITDYWGNPGRVSYFKGAYCGNGGPDGSGSAIYWWGGAHEVQGCIYAKYQQLGGSNSKLGFPISNEYTNSLGYRESDFSNGEIVWENGTAVVTYQTSCVTTGKCN